MPYVLFMTNKLNLLVRKFASKPSRDEMIPRGQFGRGEIDSGKDKNVEGKSVEKKSVRSVGVDKVMRIDNAFSTNMLMFCDREGENGSLELLYFKRSKNIKRSSTF
jgi:hypothetical protein